MSINYPLLDKSLQKKTFPKNIRTISSSFRPKKIDLDDIYEGILFTPNNKFQKKFSGKTIMNEAIKIGKKFLTENSFSEKQKLKDKEKKPNYKFVDEIIQDTHFTARNNYVEKLSENFKINLRKNFKDILIKSTSEDVDKLNKELDKIDEVKSTYEKALAENSKLQMRLLELNKELKIISNDLYKKTQVINKEQLKNISIKTIQPIFEELIKEFPEEDPKDIVTDLKINKEKYISQIHELNKFNFKINELEKERQNDDNRNKAFQNDIKEKILQQKKLTNSIVSQLDKEYIIYKDEYEILLKYQKENENLKQLLYNIYSWIKDYIPKKQYESYIHNIGKDPLQNSKNFDAKIFNSREFVALVNECILSKVTNCYDGVLLRATIAFGNYLARKHLKQYNKYRYDPVGTFREIKSVIDAKEFENYQLIGVIKDLNHKKAKSLLKIKELVHQLKKGKIKFQVLETKFQKYIKLKKKSPDLSSGKIQKLSSKTNLNSSFSLKSEKIREKSEDKKENKIEENNKLNKFRKKFFITNDGQKGKNKNNKNKHIKIQSALIPNRTLTENNKINDSFYDLNKNKKEENEDNDDDLYKQTLLSIKNREMNNIKLKSLQKKLCDLEFSKNHDKLIKSNGFNGKENLLLNIKDIMKEIYIEHPTSFTKYKKKKLYLTTNTEFNFQKEKRKKIKRPLTTELPKVNYGQDYQYISDKIMNDIDNIINRVNDFDLHDFTTDQNYKDKRNLNLFSKKTVQPPLEKKNSIDSLLKEESGQSYEEVEITENEDSEDKKDNEE